ncbi:F-box domain containing protein [Parasponia andersonii]|uniref:F-box domain containing protein n=1 Tax=Parasponia andersonii TaxID=3476 RepID=A0A2P5CJ09_PARAD|nr:F-box domain containing protein [Parasponia andersonii]
MTKIRRSISKTAASKHISILNNDLLLEVFLRLPHRRSLIQCSIVCKSWFYVISHPQFSRRFIEFQNYKRSSDSSSYYSSLPYTILFITSRNTRRPLGEIVSKKSEILNGIQYESTLPPNTSIRASFEDLLLLCRDWKEYCIYNPLTRQLLWLPDAPSPRNHLEKCGFVSELMNNGQYQFKVLLIIKYSDQENDDCVLDGATFCSETGKWSKAIFSFPKTLAPGYKTFEDFVVSNGILYSLVDAGDVKGFVAFDLSTDCTSKDDERKQCHFIELPINFGRGWRASRDKVCYGVVQGQLRLSQMVKMKREYDLKIWELDCKNIDYVYWVMLHRVRLKKEKKASMGVAAFHPNNADVIFMLRNQELYKYEIGKERYHVGELRGPDMPLRKYLIEDFFRFFQAFNVVYPPWPTLIPVLSNV